MQTITTADQTQIYANDWGSGPMQASLCATLECAKSFATTDFRPDLAAFKVPTLIIHGAEDKTVPIDAAGRAIAKAWSSQLSADTGRPCTKMTGRPRPQSLT